MIDGKLALPILDALIDSSEHDRIFATDSHSVLLRQLRESLRRDLIHLLNTRQCPHSPPAHRPHLSGSLLNYGLPDLISVNLNSARETQQLCKAIETAILRFEPRVQSAQVSVKGLPEPLEPEFYFRVEIVLNVALTEELIVFDSALDPVTQSVEVKEVAPHER
jgi:type VI secretion system protein ImpF